MFKLPLVNQDQCPSQCEAKLKETQDVVGIYKSMLNMISKVINETDDVVQGMRSTEFSDDLGKYKDVSQLVRDLYNIMTAMPKVNRLIAMMMMKMLNGNKGHETGGPHRRPATKDMEMENSYRHLDTDESHRSMESVPEKVHDKGISRCLQAQGTSFISSCKTFDIKTLLKS